MSLKGDVSVTNNHQVQGFYYCPTVINRASQVHVSAMRNIEKESKRNTINEAKNDDKIRPSNAENTNKARSKNASGSKQSERYSFDRRKTKNPWNRWRNTSRSSSDEKKRRCTISSNDSKVIGSNVNGSSKCEQFYPPRCNSCACEEKSSSATSSSSATNNIYYSPSDVQKRYLSNDTKVTGNSVNTSSKCGELYPRGCNSCSYERNNSCTISSSRCNSYYDPGNIENNYLSSNDSKVIGNNVNGSSKCEQFYPPRCISCACEEKSSSTTSSSSATNNIYYSPSDVQKRYLSNDTKVTGNSVNTSSKCGELYPPGCNFCSYEGNNSCTISSSRCNSYYDDPGNIESNYLSSNDSKVIGSNVNGSSKCEQFYPPRCISCACEEKSSSTTSSSSATNNIYYSPSDVQKRYLSNDTKVTGNSVNTSSKCGELYPPGCNFCSYEGNNSCTISSSRCNSYYDDPGNIESNYLSSNDSKVIGSNVNGSSKCEKFYPPRCISCACEEKSSSTTSSSSATNNIYYSPSDVQKRYLSNDTKVTGNSVNTSSKCGELYPPGCNFCSYEGNNSCTISSSRCNSYYDDPGNIESNYLSSNDSKVIGSNVNGSSKCEKFYPPRCISCACEEKSSSTTSSSSATNNIYYSPSDVQKRYLSNDTKVTGNSVNTSSKCGELYPPGCNFCSYEGNNSCTISSSRCNSYYDDPGNIESNYLSSNDSKVIGSNVNGSPKCDQFYPPRCISCACEEKSSSTTSSSSATSIGNYNSSKNEIPKWILHVNSSNKRLSNESVTWRSTNETWSDSEWDSTDNIYPPSSQSSNSMKNFSSRK